MQFTQQESPMNINQLHNFAMNVVENICSVFTMPVEEIIRPQFGTEYFPVPIFFFSSVVMLILPMISGAADSIVRMIPFRGAVRPPVGLFGIGSLSSLYFFLTFLHGFRLWRRMIYMELEDHSEFEGPPLPFFHLIPGSGSFWFTRIVLEPLFVFIGASLLEGARIFQSGLATYLHMAALMLMMKNFIGWYRAWQYIRKVLNIHFISPIIARLVQNKATDAELASIHLAGLPKNIAPEIRQAAVSHIARVFSTDTPTRKDENHA